MSTTEILILGCLGLGHYNPSIQLARACAGTLRQANKTPRITLISPLAKEMVVRVLPAEETKNLEINKWITRSFDNDDIEQHLFVMETMPAGKATMKALLTCQDDWLPYIRSIYERRGTQADMILADMIINIDLQLAQEWKAKTYTFFPSPLTCHHMIPRLAAQMGLTKVEDVSEPSTESTAGEDSESAPPAARQVMQFDGMPGLELDFEGETLHLDKSDGAETDPMMQAFFKMHLENSAARNGVVCNDVAEFYPAEFLKSCKMHDNFSVLPVGPLATHYEPRLEVNPNKPDSIIDWLDTKADKSCIFISVGSQFDLPPGIIAKFTQAFSRLFELNKEISIVWAHRPLSNHAEITEYKADETGIPQGWAETYAERIKIKSWVNQPRVLQHRALGLFMTHSGWNGLLEAISLGHAPLLLLPVNAEQPGNAKIMESYNQVGERLWKNISEISGVAVDHIINKINSCFNNEKYTENLAKLHRTAVEAWNAPNGTSKMNFQKLWEETTK